MKGADNKLLAIGSAFTVTATNGGTLTYGDDYTYEGGVLTIKSDKAITIANANTGSTTDRIEVADGISANITLAGVNIDVSGTSGACAFKIADNSTGNVTITLADGSVNTLKSGEYCAGLQKNGGTSTGILTIKGNTGKLTATGGNNGAGIGGGKQASTSNITMISGTIIAAGGDGGAGIGGGNANYLEVFQGGNGSYITISGGNVTANGGSGGSGIGGGNFGTGSNIKISGGTVNAVSVNGGAAIGGGWSANGTNITITGGTVIATAVGEEKTNDPMFMPRKSGGAGIGGGKKGDGTNITIKDATVTALGGENSAGIGGGFYRNGKDITISGSTVLAAGGAGAAGIGGGYEGSSEQLGGNGSNITITDSIVTAEGGGAVEGNPNQCGGAGIGGGGNGNGSDIKIIGGSVTAIKGINANVIGGGSGRSAVIPTNGSDDVYLLELDSGSPITINGKNYPTNHNGEAKIYAYLPAKSLSTPNVVNVGSTTTYCYYDTTNSKWINVIDDVTISIDDPTAGDTLATSAAVISPTTGVDAITSSDIVWKDASDNVVSGTAGYNKEYTV